MSAIGRKALGELARHRVRTALTSCTLGLALASLAVAAVPGLMDRVMNRQVRAARLYDVAMASRDLVLDRAQLSALARLPNVAAFGASLEYPAQVTAGGRRQVGTIWGIDFASQPVDAVSVLAGAPPRPGELLADAGNGSAADLTTQVGARIGVHAAGGARVLMRVTGTAHGLATSPSASNGSGGPVFYATQATVRSLAGLRGVNYLAFRLTDNSQAARVAAIAAVRGYLESQHKTEPFVALPVTRANGDWPGRAGFDELISLLYIMTALAVLSALFLVITTMNTVVAEQAGEIAILSTLGGRRSQIAGIVLRSAALLGGIGALLGAGLGIGIGCVLTSYFATTSYDLRAGFAISVPVVAGSLALGPVLAVLASLPGLRRALRRPSGQILADRGPAGFGTGRLDRLTARSRLLPGPARMGVRNILRNKRRSTATVAQIAVATGLAIALFAGGRSVAAFVSREFGFYRYSIEVDASGPAGLDNRAVAIAAAVPGVSRVEPLAESEVQYQGRGYASWGLGADPLYAYRLSAGRWFTAADSAARVPPVVLGPGFARAIGAGVGQALTLDTAAGPTRVEVIGIDTGQANDGGDIYFPLPVLQRLTGMGHSVNALWLTTAGTRPASIDRVTAAVAARLAAAGFAVSTQERYVQESDNQAQNSSFIAIIEILGLLVVAIALIGLVNTLTMSVIERTREIGVLRCLGARAWQVRRIFSAEGLMLAVIGWALGVPLGAAISRLVLLFLGHDINVTVPVVFPLVSVPVALAVIVAITRLVIRSPLRRASRIQPGDALRYQ